MSQLDATFIKYSRLKSLRYLNWIRDQPCINCGAPEPSDPHHIKGVGHFSGGGLTAPDSHAMPLCRGCHEALHKGHIPLEAQWSWLARTATKGIVELLEGRMK